MVGAKNERLRSSEHGGARERALLLAFARELRWLKWETSDQV